MIKWCKIKEVLKWKGKKKGKRNEVKNCRKKKWDRIRRENKRFKAEIKEIHNGYNT